MCAHVTCECVHSTYIHWILDFKYIIINHVAPYRYLLPTVYLSVANIPNSDLLACGCRTGISLDISRFNEEQCQPSSWSAWPTLNRAPIAGDRRGRHNLHIGLPDRSNSATACRLCRWSQGCSSRILERVFTTGSSIK